MKRVFIHIGLPKTATSSIQSFLYDNGAFLEQHGYHYLQTGLNHSLKCHHDMVWKLGLHKGPSYVEKGIEKYRLEILDSLKTEVSNHQDKNLIISSELLTFIHDFKKLVPILEIFKGREVKFILNLRRQDRFLESLYQQVVKDGINQSFEQWFHHSRRIANYNILVNRLLQVTKKENIIIDIFDARIENLHPTENFLVSLGFKKLYLQGFNIENIRENESLTREQIDRLLASNKVNPNLRFSLMQEFLEENKEITIDKAQYLNDKWREKIIESFKISNLKLIDLLQITAEKSKLLLS